MPHAPRPTASAGARSASVPTIDPIKLFKKYFWLLVVATIIGGAFGVGSFLALRKFLPRYDAVTLFKISAPQTNSTELAEDKSQQKEPLERFMSTQAQIMVSDKVLDNAVHAPALINEATTWISEFRDSSGAIAYSDAVCELQKTVSARPIPKSEFVRLTMSYSKANDAAVIARQITQAYMTELSSDRGGSRADLRESMSKRVKQLNEDIERNSSDRDRIITENQLESLDSRMSEAYAALTNAVDTLAAIQNSITSYTTQQEDYQRILASPGGIVYPEDIRTVAEQDPIVMQTKNTLQTLEAQDRSFEKQDLGLNHPARKALRAQIDGIREELEVTRERIMSTAFNSQLDQIRRVLLQLRAQETEQLDSIDEDKDRLNELAKLQQEIREYDRKIEKLGERLADTQAALDELNDVSALKSADRVSIYQYAKIPDKMAFPDPKIIIPAGVVLVLGLTVGLILLREVLDQRIKGPADVAMIPRTPILGMVPIASEDPSRPERPETAFLDRPTGIIAESIRQLRVAATKKMQQAGHRSLLVVPATPQSGATTFVTNLSEACARADMKTLVVDANLRRPKIHTLFNLEASPGLVDILADACEIDDAICSTDNPNLDVMTVGSGEHRMFERIVTDPMGQLLTRLEAKYDIVILDTAPAIVAGDAVGLANRCGATVLVARAMAEKRGTIARLKSELSDTRAEFLGVMINAVRPSAGGYFRRNIRAAHAYQQRGKKSAKA